MRRRPSTEDEDPPRASKSFSTTSPRLSSRSSERPGKSQNARDSSHGRRSTQDHRQGKENGVVKAQSVSSTAAKSTSWSDSTVADWSSSKSLDEQSSNDKATADVPTATTSTKPAANLRQRGPWSCSILTLITTACSILLLITIFRSFLTLQLDPKGCAMSYMRPAFARFTDFDTEHTRFASKYSLYLYREGGVDEDTRVKGIPVLFIPGNAGSYKQVRPIAAEAAHYFHDTLREDPAAIDMGKRPLDVFTVDFNEELTAFHGQTLLDQAEYLNEAVAYILTLYHNPNRSLREPGLPDPKSVIIIGHSMGGMVARTMLSMPNYQEHSINTIFTLSTPHARAPVSFDAQMVATYDQINRFWRQSFLATTANKNPLSDLTLISVAGGGLDTMIPSEFSSLTSLVPDTHGFTVFTSTIPSVWTGMDHLAIMWCDQFRKALVRAIFDVVDVRGSSQTLERAARINALRKRLLTGMEAVVEKAALDSLSTTHLTLDAGTTTITPHGDRLVIDMLGQAGPIRANVMPIPADQTIDGGRFTLLTDQVIDDLSSNSTVSVLLCTLHTAAVDSQIPLAVASIDGPSSSTRLACKNAAGDVSLLPRSTYDSHHAFDQATPFSYLQYTLSDLIDYQFLAVIDKSAEPTPGWVVAEFARGSQSSIQFKKGHHELLIDGLHLQLPPTRPSMFELKIPEVHSTMFAYRLQFDLQLQGQCAEKFAPLLRQSIQEPYESKYFVNTKGGNINVHGVSPYMPPPLRGGEASEGLSLQFWTDTTCPSVVDIKLTVDILGSAGKLVMRYRTAFAAFPLLVVAIVLRKQFKVYDATGLFISFSHGMDQCIRTSLPVIFTALTFLAISLSKAAHGPWVHSVLTSPSDSSGFMVDFTINDLMLGTSDPFFWFLVPLFGLISVGVCMAAHYLVLTLSHVITMVWEQIRYWTTSTTDQRKQGAVFAGASAQQRLITTAVLLLLVATVVPYHFAYLVLCLLQLATSIRALVVARDINSGNNYNFYNYTHSLLVLMLAILPINMPVLVVWIHNLTVHWLTPFSTHHNLLSVLPYILLIETISTGSMLPRASLRLRFITNILLFAFALYAAVYGVSYAYRLHHMVNGLCAWLFFLHLLDGPLSLAKWAARPADGRNNKKTP